MMNKNSEQLAVGTIVGYSRRLNFLSARINVLVKVDGRIVKVPIDYRQKKFIQSESPEGSKVAIGFFDGEWHIGSKPASHDLHLREVDIPVMDLLDKVNCETRESKPSATTAGEAEEVAQIDQIYIKSVELEFKDEASVILRRIGLAHLMVIS